MANGTREKELIAGYRKTTYGQWLQREGLPVVHGYGVEDVRQIERAHWPRSGGKWGFTFSSALNFNVDLLAPPDREDAQSQKQKPKFIRRLSKISFLIFLLSPFFLVYGQEWKKEWEKTLAAARKEAQLVIYGGSDYDLLFAEFQKKYPEIKVVSVIATGREVAQRIMTERRAGKYLADLYLDGASTAYSVLYKGKVIEPIKPLLILPEVFDPSAWWMQGKYNYSDDESQYIFSYDGELQPYFAYNTKLVNSRDLNSYWDLLDPKWKGKMVVLDPTIGGPVATPLRFIYYHPDLGPKFLRRLLGEMDLTPSRDVRQISDWLAVGKFAISVFTTYSRTGFDTAKKQGLSVDWFGAKAFKEGIPLSNANGNVAIINRAPHPNAARLAVNWLLSREGQIAYQRIVNSGISNSLRVDIPKDIILPEYQRVEGGNYVVTERPEWMDMAPILKVVGEVWKKEK